MCEVFRWNGADWNPLGAGQAVCGGGICTRQRNNITEFWHFAIGNNVSLPVRLLSFTALAREDRTIALSWATADEINNERFEIERSNDTHTWMEIGRVHGENTPGIHNYAFADMTPNTGENYYRLRQVDIDGRHEYSPIALARITAGTSRIVGPNPAREFLYIHSDPAIILHASVFDIFGRVLASSTLSGGMFDIAEVPPGLFFVKLSDGSLETVHRLMKCQ
jgi:hypothetical protein